MLRAALLSLAACAALQGVPGADARRGSSNKGGDDEKRVCPHPTLSSHDGGAHVDLLFVNELDSDLTLYWVDTNGQEVDSGMVEAGTTSTEHGSFWEHVFRARITATHKLVWEARLSDIKKEIAASGAVIIRPCDDEKGFDFNANERAEEFAKLVDRQDAPCEGSRSEWSCVRSLTDAEYADRLGGDDPHYGFRKDEVLPGSECAHRYVGQVFDNTYMDHTMTIPRLSKGPGYLKMKMPDSLREKLQTFFEENKKKAGVHDLIYGGFTNNHIFPFDHINLDHFRTMHQEIIDEMQQVLQWWTQQRLMHTSTFGIRLYRRGATLLNHVDRADTHLASAVLQVAQDVDEGDGWPIEVHTEKHGAKEVYLQPGEMVLYEGAWVVHGRPERFNGTMFANVFTHFKPLDWAGPPRNGPRTPPWYERMHIRSDGTNAFSPRPVHDEL